MEIGQALRHEGLANLGSQARTRRDRLVLHVVRARHLEEHGLRRAGRGENSALTLATVAVSGGKRGVDALRGEQAGHGSGNNECDDPPNAALAKDLPVDTLLSLEEGDTGGGSNLAVSSRERQAQVRADDDDNGGTELDGEATRRGDHGELDADRTHNLVAVHDQAKTNANAAEGENPAAVVASVGLFANAAIAAAVIVDGEDGHEGAHCVGNVIGTVGERVEDGGEDLNVAEDGLGGGVKLLGVVVHGVHKGISARTDDVVDVLVEVVLAKDGHHLTHRRRGGFVVLVPLGGVLNTLVKGALINHLLDTRFDHLEEREAEEGDSGADAAADTKGGPALNLAVAVAQDTFIIALLADGLGDTLGDDEEGVDPHGNEDEERVEEDGAVERVLALHDEVANESVEHHRKDTREHGREDPGERNTDDTAGNVELVGILLLEPHDAGRALDGDGHADHATDGRVSRRNGHLGPRRQEQPEAHHGDDAEVAVHEERRVHVGGTVAIRMGNALADGVRDSVTGSKGTEEFEDSREEASLLDGQRLGADGGGVPAWVHDGLRLGVPWAASGGGHGTSGRSRHSKKKSNEANRHGRGAQA